MAISTKISGDVPPVFSKNSLIPQAYGDADGPEILVQMPLGERFWRTMVQLNNASENANVWDVCLDVFGMFVFLGILENMRLLCANKMVFF